MDKKIAGVVLAGGRSSRMGENKALLDYNGQPLLDHMIALLKQTGLNDIYVSGNLEGYNCIPDTAPYEGPARAISDVLDALKSSTSSSYEGILFLPVDMPFLEPEMLRILLESPQGACFEAHPLPFYITKEREKNGSGKSVKEFLSNAGIPSLPLPPKFQNNMTNVNTPKEWKEARRA